MQSVSSDSPGTASITTSASTPPAYHFTPKVRAPSALPQHPSMTCCRNVLHRLASTLQTSCRSWTRPESACGMILNFSCDMILNFSPVLPQHPLPSLTSLSRIFPFRFFIDHDQGIAYFYPPAAITTGSVFLSLAPAAVVANGISGFPPFSPCCSLPILKSRFNTRHLHQESRSAASPPVTFEAPQSAYQAAALLLCSTWTSATRVTGTPASYSQSPVQQQQQQHHFHTAIIFLTASQCHQRRRI
jgi:hypothetical protein